MFADAVHAVVPVAAANQRQAEFAVQFQALIQTTRAMLEQRCGIASHHRLEEGIVLARLEQRPFEEGDWLVENRQIARDLDIGRRGER